MDVRATDDGDLRCAATTTGKDPQAWFQHALEMVPGLLAKLEDPTHRLMESAHKLAGTPLDECPWDEAVLLQSAMLKPAFEKLDIMSHFTYGMNFLSRREALNTLVPAHLRTCVRLRLYSGQPMFGDEWAGKVLETLGIEADQEVTVTVVDMATLDRTRTDAEYFLDQGTMNEDDAWSRAGAEAVRKLFLDLPPAIADMVLQSERSKAWVFGGPPDTDDDDM